MRSILILVLGLSVPFGVAAQDLNDDYDDYDVAILDLCLENAETRADRESCIGRASNDCMTTEAGQSTLGQGYCMSQEWQQWDQRLNTVYQRLLVQQVELAEDNAAFNPQIPDAVELLRDMQRKWVAFRDAACDWEYVQWGGGTGAGPASAECMMRLTAHQTLFLEGRSH
ncbi:lysozyme inhibitor LprI family protein [Octadecabacter sp. 1_MG-2023]|uniref:lysozyme inhibitor LprI family protein n=1 Tax=unclassified Octadecabacter TaxID=196158 RepID=UPI001C0A657E|nr:MULTISPECIES: lysozyme inhibitor LprI family protein [unclassified Octadecabacter]MBU2993827.1 DUF1311 domain-containing protein [Octadecabacter sp. B2R22]MDO6735327.1 lysozyme inhibitor LprI family protein [Octadecabacter sp. 1_MG-2023]